MPRNGSGGYALPEAPFVPNTAILSAEVNSDFDDIADALTGSVAADGQTLMTGPLQGFPGSLALPGYTWTTDPNTGRYHSAADEMKDVVGGVAAATISATGVEFPLGASVAGTSLVMPAGVMVPYGGATAPTGWLLCFGQSVLRADFPALFTAIGTAYGSADGTHFTLPDLRGRVPAGKDNMGGSAASRLTATTMTPDGVTLAAVGGAQTVTLSQANLPAATLTTTITDPGHAHALTAPVTFAGPGTAGGSPNNIVQAGSANTQSATTGITASTALGGSGTATDKIQPSIVVNYIIKT